MDEQNRLRLLRGNPAIVNNLPVYAPTLDIIDSIGTARFNRLTQLLCMSQIDLELLYDEQKLGDDVPTPYNFLRQNSLIEPMFFLELQVAFLTYLKKEIILSADGFVLHWPETETEPEQDILIDEETFNKLQTLILEINFLKEEDEREFNADKSQQNFVKIFEEARKKLRLAKERERRAKNLQQGSSTTFPDIVSSLCAYGIGYTLFNVWDLTIYQFYDQLYRSQAKEAYEENLNALMAGADKNKLDLKYWMKEILIK